MRHGALAVIETPRSKDSINYELKALDSRLFLERQLTLSQERVWCVCIELSDGEVYTVLEWRDPEGHPLEPSSGLVERMRRMVAQGDASTLGKEAARKNQAKVEAEREERFEMFRDLAMAYRSGVLRGDHIGPLVPRSPALARSRARARDKENTRKRLAAQGFRV